MARKSYKYNPSVCGSNSMSSAHCFDCGLNVIKCRMCLCVVVAVGETRLLTERIIHAQILLRYPCDYFSIRFRLTVHLDKSIKKNDNYANNSRFKYQETKVKGTHAIANQFTILPGINAEVILRHPSLKSQ